MNDTQGAGKKRKIGRAPRWNLELCGDEDVKRVMKAKLHDVKSQYFSKNATNTEILEVLLDSYCKEKSSGSVSNPPSTSHSVISRDATSENVILTTVTALENLLAIAGRHKSCTGVVSIANTRVMRGFANRLKLNCSEKLCPHITEDAHFVWTSCKHGSEEQARFTINTRMLHAYYSSGLLPSQFRSLMVTLGLQYQHAIIDQEIASYSSALTKVIRK